MKKQHIVKVGANYEVKLPMETWEGIGVKPGDTIEFYNETGAEGDGLSDYEYIEIRKPNTTVKIPMKNYIEIQERIDRKEIPFQTVEETVIHAIEKMIGAN